MAPIDVSERNEMRETFARFLADRCTEAHVRAIMATDDAHDPEIWSAMAEMGILATLVPQDHDGLGGGALEIETLMEEAGSVLLPGPFFSSAVLATQLLASSQDGPTKQRLLPRLADGSVIGTVALTGDKGLWNGQDCDVAVSGDGEEVTLSGSANYVSDGALADLVLVVAGQGSDRRLYEVTGRSGLTVTPLTSFDPTQRLARLQFCGAPVRLVPSVGAAEIDRALDMARIALAGRQAGAARRNFDATVEYLRTRVQFGRTIGGFQAVKHMAADLLIESESAITGARSAAEAYAAGEDIAEELVALASFAVSEAQQKIAFDAIQLHGGIAFTWEHPAHLYLRRARHDAMFLGSNDLARDRLITILENAA